MPDAAASIPVLQPTGTIDVVTSRDLAHNLGGLAGTPGDAVLDLTEVDFMDSVGLGVVLKAASRFHRQDKQLVLVVPPEGNVARLMDLAGVRGRFAITQTREEALALASAQR